MFIRCGVRYRRSALILRSARESERVSKDEGGRGWAIRDTAAKLATKDMNIDGVCK